jgi:hypothetical protein
MRRLCAAAGSVIVALGLVAIGPATPAHALARCDHGVHVHDHNGHPNQWVFQFHFNDNLGNHVHMAYSRHHNQWDSANC